MPVVFPYVTTTHLRLDVINLRLSSVMVEDNIRMAQHLSFLRDPALMTQRMGEVLLQTTMRGAEASRKQCIKLLGEDVSKKVPALACELQLRQVQLWLLEHCGLEAMPRETLLDENLNDSIDHKLEDIPGMLATLDSVLEMSKRYPQTCGSFGSATTHFKHLLQKVVEAQSVIAVSGIDITSARKVESRFREYVGAKTLATCVEGHPYFEDIFGKNGCPDCGKKVKLDDEVFRDSGKHLFENDFLAAMETIYLHSSPQKSPILAQGGDSTNGHTNGVAKGNANGVKSHQSTSSIVATTTVAEGNASTNTDAPTEVLEATQATPVKAPVPKDEASPVKLGGTDEDAFLQAMVDRGWSFKSDRGEKAGSLPLKAQKTPEELFLENMEKVMAEKLKGSQSAA